MDKVQHFEIPVDDTKRARKFYESCFGWKTVDFPMPGGNPYIGLHTGPVDKKNLWKEPGFINGGMFKRDKEVPVKGPVVTVTVEDIKKTLKKIKKCGGTVLTDTKKVADMGLYAYVKDPEGNIMGVWQELNRNGVFDPLTVKVGDKVGSFTVTYVSRSERYPESGVTVQFRGEQIVVTGSHMYINSSIPVTNMSICNAIKNLDEASFIAMPKVPESTRDNYRIYYPGPPEDPAPAKDITIKIHRFFITLLDGKVYVVT